MGKRLTKRQRKNIRNFAIKNWTLVIGLIIIILALAITGYYLGWFDKWLNPDNGNDGDFNPSSIAGKNVTTTVDELKDLEITFLDIGQGDCIVLQLPDGKNMMIDAGDRTSYTQNAIEEFTEAEGITTFGYLLLTHEDADHCGRMAWVIETYEIKYIFRPNMKSTHKNASSLPEGFNQGDGNISTSASYANTLVAMYNEGCPTEFFDKDSDFENKVVCGGEEYKYSFNFLTPTANGEDVSYDEDNDYSPIILFEYAGVKVLFTGDAGEANLAEYMSNYDDDYNIDIYKVSHHGSKNNISNEFISAIDPEYAIIQCGVDNSHTHPDKEALEILHNYDSNMKLYRNDTNGNIYLTITSAGTFDFELEKEDCSGNWIDGDGIQVAFNVKREVVFDERKLQVA